jgi:hypothetical protein
MDIVRLTDHLRRKIEVRTDDLTLALSSGSVQNWEQYKMTVGEIRGLSFIEDELRALLRNSFEDDEEHNST